MVLTKRILTKAAKIEAGHTEDKAVTPVIVKTESSWLVTDKAQAAWGQASSPDLGYFRAGVGAAPASPHHPQQQMGYEAHCMVSPHREVEASRTLPGHGTTRLGDGTSLTTWKGVQSISAHQRLEDALLDKAMKTQSIAILQAGSLALSGVKAPQGISCGFQLTWFLMANSPPRSRWQS